MLTVPALRWFVPRVLALALVIEAHLAAVILWWPDFVKSAPALRALLPIAAIREKFDQVVEGGIFGYVVGQHLFKFANLIGPIAATLFAVGAIAGEAHRGTLEIWLSRPLSRRRLLSERWLAGALALLVPLFATTLSVPWLLNFVGERIELRPLVLATAHEGAFLLAFYALAFACSSLGRSPLAIALVLISIDLFELAIYLIETVTHASVFRLVDLDRFMAIQERAGLDWSVVGPLLAFALAAYGVSLTAFARRTP